MKLSGKVALVTGGSSGIGKAVGFYLAEEGADIVVNYHSNDAAAEEVVKQILSMGRRAMAIKADVAKHAEVKEMFAKIVNEFSTLDILVNNAGIGNLMTAVGMTDEGWNLMLGTHLYGTMNCTREALNRAKS